VMARGLASPQLDRRDRDMRTIRCRAAVFDSASPRHLGIRQFEIPAAAGDDELLLKTEMCGICGADLHVFDGWYECGQIIPGHEFVGRVVSVGRSVRDASGGLLRQGDRVVPESYIPCGECLYCRGVGSRYDKVVDNAACEDSILFGHVPLEEPVRLSGGYSEYVQIPRRALLHKIPEGIPAEEAVLLEPLAVAVRAVRRASVVAGDTVVVQGPGPIGLLSLVTAQIAGATTVMLTGRDGDEARLELAEELGAARVVDVTQEDCLEALLSLTGGRKADRVIDATGAVSAFWQGVEMTSRGGVYVNIGGFRSDTAVSIYPDYLKRNKIDIRFSHTGANHYQAAREIIRSNRFPLDKLVTRRVALERAEEALTRLTARTGDDVKVVIEMDE
jgi:alcohol dehydrogenase